jgi:lipopolysaccharide/colanic/teichoic acid biosynthesis glycosyltransferase
MYKFRSMRVAAADREGQTSARREDDRITRVGALIRRTSIDELPQLINVLKGEMSIVGPRPHALGSQAGTKLFWEIDQRYWTRHALKPGLTGLAQVRGLRGATDLEADLSRRLVADLEYVDGWSLGRDVRIVLRTLSVLTHDRAY